MLEQPDLSLWVPAAMNGDGEHRKSRIQVGRNGPHGLLAQVLTIAAMTLHPKALGPHAGIGRPAPAKFGPALRQPPFRRERAPSSHPEPSTMVAHP
jgi:hypothetical protein